MAKPESLGDVVAGLARGLGVVAGPLLVPHETRLHACAGDCGREIEQVRHALLSEGERRRLGARGADETAPASAPASAPPRPPRWGDWAPLLCEDCRLEREASWTTTAVSVDQRAERLARLDVPREYRDATIQSYTTRPPESTPAQQALFRAARLHARWMVEHWTTRDADGTYPHITLFAGGPGGGKGHLEWAIAKAVGVEFGAGVIFVTLSELIKDLRSAWQQGARFSEASILERYRRADLLVIDEVSQHAFHGEPVQHLYDVVAWRSDAWRTTIISSNHPLGGTSPVTGLPPIVDVIGQPLMSRVARWGGIVEFPEDYDYRLVLAAQVQGARTEARSAAEPKGPRRMA